MESNRGRRYLKYIQEEDSRVCSNTSNFPDLEGLEQSVDCIGKGLSISLCPLWSQAWHTRCHCMWEEYIISEVGDTFYRSWLE